MSVFDIVVAAAIGIGFICLVVRLVTDTVDDRRRANDPDAPTTWAGADYTETHHHEPSHHYGGDHGGGHHGGGGDFGGGHHG